MTVSESLLQITELTKKNMQILQMINDSFYTKANHLSTIVGETSYTIPSYIALENKVNHLQDAFNNLVHASKSGEAWFNFDGNSKEINVRGYQSAPSPINLTVKTNFETEAKTLFKDLLTPQPYLNFDMKSLPDDINKVRVKKVIPYAADLINRLNAACAGEINDKCGSASMTWQNFKNILESGDREDGRDYISGVDYLEYETDYDLPVRHCTRSGSYVIEEVLTDQITENLENIITVRISSKTPLLRVNFDGDSESNLQAGDVLTTYDGSAKLKIQSIQTSGRILTLLVLSGEYVNPVASGSVGLEDASDYSILKLFSSTNDNRELHIPLEEDQYVYITVAPLNPRLNIQSQWGDGLYVNVDNLTLEGSNGVTKFRSYYNENVLNIGDALIELATVSYPSVTKFNKEEITAMTEAPVLDGETLQVVQINKHLNDSEAVKNIRALYSQKKQYQADLAEVQGRIASLTESLAQISFDDMSGTRSAYTAQIADLKDQQNNLTTSINKIVNSISLAANDSEIPIEGAKFRVRGYVDVEKFVGEVEPSMRSESEKSMIRDNILGVQIRYRYRNSDIPQANVSVIGDSFLFTEWSTYNPPLRERKMVYENGSYKIERPDVDSDGFRMSENEPKFNQVDIPISQGEVVEIQARILWGFGYPFVTVATDWSDSYTQTFPPELVTDVQVTTIIEENNNDIETNRFETILSTKGVTTHVDDAIDDQDVRYMHKPESISSGFYTEERRVIPLKDKLLTMDGDITEIKDMIQGTTSDALRVTCIVDGISTILAPDVDNVIQLPAYSNLADSEEGKIPTGSAFKYKEVAYAPVIVTLSNITAHTIHLFSMFPGGRDQWVKDAKYHVFDPKSFIDEVKILASDADMTPSNLDSGPAIVWTADDSGTETMSIAHPQRMNQIVTFRRTNPYDGSPLGDGGNYYPDQVNGYTYKVKLKKDETPRTDKRRDIGLCGIRMSNGLLDTKYTENKTTISCDIENGLDVYPTCPTQFGMCMNGDAVNSKVSLAPGESISFSIHTEYKLSSNVGDNSSAFTIGFNVRNSLYTDALYYQIKFVAKYQQSTNDQMLTSKTNIDALTKYNVTVR